MLLPIRWIVGLALLCCAVALVDATKAHGAANGVPIPAPAGTQWRIVAGYNTGTHSHADGSDPHAIDIARTDAATDWTEVLSPVDGEVGWRGNDGLFIVDANELAHLIVHIEPEAHVERGRQVRVGELVGRVFPAGHGNGGIAHIHYAIHHTHGGGYLGESIPFTGDYAIEGVELAWRDEYNLHSDRTFTSSNVAGWTGPAVRSAPIDPAPEESAPEEPASTVPYVAVDQADAPIGGWRMVGVARRTTVSGLHSDLAGPIAEIVVQDAQRREWLRFDPTDEASADTALRRVTPGQAVWARVSPEAAWLPPAPAQTQRVTIPLRSGANFVAWLGSERAITEALRNVAHLQYAYRYDPIDERWQLYAPSAPALLNTLQRLSPGDALFIVVGSGSTWTQLP